MYVSGTKVAQALARDAPERPAWPFQSAHQAGAVLMAQELCQTERFVEHGIPVTGKITVTLQSGLPGRAGRRIANLRSNRLLFSGPPVANLQLLLQQGCFIHEEIFGVVTGGFPAPE